LGNWQIGLGWAWIQGKGWTGGLGLNCAAGVGVTREEIGLGALLLSDIFTSFNLARLAVACRQRKVW
jgi:hypothetical protein